MWWVWYLLRLLLKDSSRPVTTREWRTIVVKAVCLAWYEPSFLPPSQVESQMRALGLTGPMDGSGGDQITIRLFNKKLDVKGLRRVVESRKAELLRRQNEPSRDLEEIEKEGDGENENEGEVEEEEVSEVAEREDEGRDFPDNLKIGDFIALFVPEEESLCGFLIGKVIDPAKLPPSTSTGGKVTHDGVPVHWYTPASKLGKGRGKWTPLYEKFPRVPAAEAVRRTDVIPHELQAQGGQFSPAGFTLTRRCYQKLVELAEKNDRMIQSQENSSTDFAQPKPKRVKQV